MTRMLALLCLLALAASLGAAQAEAPIAIDLPRQLTPYRTTLIQGSAAEAGLLSLWLTDPRRELPLVTDQPIAPGPFELTLRGTYQDDSPWPRGDYMLRWRWQPAEGSPTTMEQRLRVTRPGNYLQFALPHRNRLSLQQKHPSLRIDYQARGGGLLRMDTLRAGQPERVLKSERVQIEDGLPRHLQWKPSAGGRALAPGSYQLRLRVDGSEQEPLLIDIELTREELPDPDPMQGFQDLYLPDSLDDEAVWQALQSPIVVTTAGEGARVIIYEGPSTKTDSLGVVRGSTAAVKLLAEAENGFVKVGAHRYGDGAYVEGYIQADRLTRVWPSPRYGILIDKRSQTLTVYEEGRKLGTLRVSTGRGYQRRPEISLETSEGAYLTTSRQRSFFSYGYYFDYPIHMDGGNLIHSVGYQRYDGGKADFTDHTALLGQKVSHGCVRVALESEDSELSIYWLYAHIPYHTKVLVVDDPSAESLYRQAQGETPR